MIYEFEGYELDTARLEVRRVGAVLPVEPQVFEVLAYLVEHRDRVVPKEELLDNIWGDRFVSESALTSRIKAARRLIGDDGSQQRLIRTVYGRGYRFVATIAGSDTPGATRHSAVADRANQSRPGWLTVGRGRELDHLRTVVDAARQGERRIVFISGAAGIGKTTLVERLVGEITDADAAVGFGQCVEHRGAGEAYLPVFEAVQQLCTSPTATNVVEHVVERAPTWVHQMPGLVPASRAADGQLAAIGASPDRMLRELLEALQAAAGDAFVVLVLEDLHWSDGSTLDLLEAIAMDRRQCRLLVVTTHRSGGPQSRTVHALAVGLRLRNRAELVTLDALTEADVRELLVGRLGCPAPGELAALLHTRTGGIPLFAERLLESWLDERLIVPAEDGVRLMTDLETLAAGVPDNVRQLIEHRFERLQPEEQAILAAASVAGREFAAAEVAAATQRTEDDVEAQLADLGRRGVFVQPRGERTWPDNTVTSRFAFEHDLHRDVLYDRIGPKQTATLHRAIADRLEQVFGCDGSSAATLAAHCIAAADAARAVRYCTLAAEHQMRRSAHREAVKHLECAAEMLARLPATRARVEEQLHVQIALGNALITGQGYAAPETAAAYAEARRLCDELGDGPHFLPVLYGLWNNSVVGGQHPSAYELATTFLRLAEQLDHDAIMVARRAVGWPLVFMGRADEARSQLELIPPTIDPSRTAELIANYGEDPAAAGRAALSWARWLTGDDNAAQQASRESLDRAESIDHPLTHVYALVVAAVLAQLRDDPSAAEQHSTRAADIAREHAIPVFAALAMIPLGWARARAGEDDAAEIVRDGLAAGASTGTGVLQPLALATLGEILSARDDIDAALTAFDDAMTVAAASGETFYTPEIERLRSEALLRIGDRLAARKSAARAAELASALKLAPFVRRATTMVARIGDSRPPSPDRNTMP
jgi:DNA-binding winged helix-turn-helix (wHTH) protein/tetratricopeptide (TPR) repeat protein